MFQKIMVLPQSLFLVPFSQLPGWILSERHCETSKACRITGVFLKPLYLWDLCVNNLDLRPENAWKKVPTILSQMVVVPLNGDLPSHAIPILQKSPKKTNPRQAEWFED